MSYFRGMVQCDILQKTYMQRERNLSFNKSPQDLPETRLCRRSILCVWPMFLFAHPTHHNVGVRYFCQATTLTLTNRNAQPYRIREWTERSVCSQTVIIHFRKGHVRHGEFAYGIYSKHERPRHSAGSNVRLYTMTAIARARCTAVKSLKLFTQGSLSMVASNAPRNE